MLSEAARAQLGRAFQVIAQLAPTLGEAELRTLIALTQLFGSDESQSGRISSRTLAALARVSRANIKTSLHSLAEKNIIATRAGTATLPSAHVLTFMRTTQMGGITVSPPPLNFQQKGGITPGPPPEISVEKVGSFQAHPGITPGPPPEISVEKVGSFQAHPGITPGPPPHDEGDAPAPASIDSIRTSDSIIDRLLRANPKRCDPVEIRQLRSWVYGYQCKRGRDKDPHPPDDKILSQLLAIAPLHRLVKMIEVLTGEPKNDENQPYGYGWYPTVALQRIHGIPPDVFKSRRAELRVAPQRRKTITGEQQPLIDEQSQPDPQFARDLIAETQRKRKGARG
jgi:hypothetical protein